MRRRKHKRTTNTVVLVTNDAPDPQLKQVKVKPWLLRSVVILLCLLLGGVIGYFLYEEKIWETAIDANKEKVAAIEELQAENDSLKEQLAAKEEEYQTKLAAKEEEMRILSNTLQDRIKSEGELAEQLEKQKTPTEFPLSGSASIEDVETEEVICVFKGMAGTNVVAAAGGIVEAVSDDTEYGHSIRINHENGYVSIYRNKGEPTVKPGDTVVLGTTLYTIDDKNEFLGYQILYENEFIDPMEMLTING